MPKGMIAKIPDSCLLANLDHEPLPVLERPNHPPLVPPVPIAVAENPGNVLLAFSMKAGEYVKELVGQGNFAGSAIAALFLPGVEDDVALGQVNILPS